jgi:ABC-type multidrug transport system fused ATPase/permease subunit
MTDQKTTAAFRKIYFFFSSFPRAKIVLPVFLTVIQGLVEVFTVGVLVPFVALLSNPESSLKQAGISKIHEWLGHPELREFVVLFGLLIAGIAALKTVYVIFLRRYFFRLTFGIQDYFATRLFEAYLAKDYSFYTRSDSSILLRNVTAITGSLVTGLMMPALSVLADGIVFFLLIGALFYVNPFLTSLLALTLGALLLLSHHFLRSYLKRIGVERMEVSGEGFRLLSEAFQGFKELKVLGRERHFEERFSGISERLSEIEASFATINALPPLFNEFLGVLTVVGAVLILIWRGASIETIIPSVSFYLLAAYRLIPALGRISPALHSISFYSESMELIYEEIASLPPRSGEAAISGRMQEALELKSGIEVRSVDFSYEGGARVLDRVTIDIPKNSSVALVGPSGAGKTTMVDLLLGLYLPEAGEIRVDGVPITVAHLESWRRNVGYVPQNIYLSDRTLAENVAFGLPRSEIDREAVAKAVRLAQLDEVVAALPQGVDTLIGERGIKLSGGQRQRIGIARALYRDPALIVFDEATSAMDNLTEAEIVAQIQNLGRVKTLVIIAHRLSTVRQCDRIYLMEKGKVSASGSYDELMRVSPLFARMNAASAAE